MEAHGRILGVVLLVFGFLIAFAVSEWVGRFTLQYDRSLGFAVAGLVIAAADLGIRKLWGEGEFVQRYVAPGYGPRVSLATCWMVGIGFVMLGVFLALR